MSTWSRRNPGADTIGRPPGRDQRESEKRTRGDCHIATGASAKRRWSGIFRLLRLPSAMCPSPQREARGAFGLK